MYLDTASESVLISRNNIKLYKSND